MVVAKSISQRCSKTQNSFSGVRFSCCDVMVMEDSVVPPTHHTPDPVPVPHLHLPGGSVAGEPLVGDDARRLGEVLGRRGARLDLTGCPRGGDKRG